MGVDDTFHCRRGRAPVEHSQPGTRRQLLHYETQLVWREGGRDTARWTSSFRMQGLGGRYVPLLGVRLRFANTKHHSLAPHRAELRGLLQRLVGCNAYCLCLGYGYCSLAPPAPSGCGQGDVSVPDSEVSAAFGLQLSPPPPPPPPPGRLRSCHVNGCPVAQPERSRPAMATLPRRRRRTPGGGIQPQPFRCADPASAVCVYWPSTMPVGRPPMPMPCVCDGGVGPDAEPRPVVG